VSEDGGKRAVSWQALEATLRAAVAHLEARGFHLAAAELDAHRDELSRSAQPTGTSGPAPKST
jgi:hypothetical protein